MQGSGSGGVRFGGGGAHNVRGVGNRAAATGGRQPLGPRGSHLLRGNRSPGLRTVGWGARGVAAVTAAAAGCAVFHHLTADKCMAREAVTDTSTREERLARWMHGWSIGRTAFHRSAVCPTVLDNEREWLQGDHLNVLVPLCGKTVDIPYIAGLGQVASVVGVEGVPLAVEQFNQENPKLRMRRAWFPPTKNFVVYAGEKVQICMGDFFEFDDTSSNAKAFDRVWDRGSLVAIDPALRERYVAVLDGVLVPGGKILLEALDRKKGPDAARKKGPPFSLTEADIRQLFDSKRYTVKKLSSFNILKGEGYERFKVEGLTVMNQEAWLITKKM